MKVAELEEPTAAADLTALIRRPRGGLPHHLPQSPQQHIHILSIADECKSQSCRAMHCGRTTRARPLPISLVHTTSCLINTVHIRFLSSIMDVSALPLTCTVAGGARAHRARSDQPHPPAAGAAEPDRAANSKGKKTSPIYA